MVKAGIIGVTSYTGEELIKVLLRHPEAEITALSARIEEETAITKLYPQFSGLTELSYKTMDVDEISGKCDVIFLALPHTVSMGVAPEFLKKGKRVIDLSSDYRLPGDVYEKWYGTEQTDTDNLGKGVYGLPEINRDSIKKALLIANPGCYPTSVILALLPVIKNAAGKKAKIIADSKSGVTGAGRKALLSLTFGEVDGNFKCYKPNAHQHMPEIDHILSAVAENKVEINFVPHLLPIRRGILSTVYVPSDGLGSEKDIFDIYSRYFKDEPFVRIKPLGEMPEIKDVAGTNFCDIGIREARGTLIIVSAIDNLLKGASGQAVQNMNIMYGIDERAGLK
ncbi:MAG: N-acetyl-gamma-glutamyl-phosphate reductase [Candidatus Omnitrophota bacterium]